MDKNNNKIRIIPIFTYKNNVLVKSINYKDYRNVNSILPVIRLFNKRNIDEMIFLNLEDKIDFNLLTNFVNEVDYPITYGGAIQDIQTMKKIFNMGFDKISLNSLLYTNLELVKEASAIFGKQSIVCSIDVRKVYINENDYIYKCYYNNGQTDSGLTIYQHLETIIQSNCLSEVIITSIDNEGTFAGFDNNLYSRLKTYNIRILVNGGGNFNEDNILKTIKNKNIYGLCFSSLFFFKQYTPNNIKQLLIKNNINCVNKHLC